MSSYNFRLNCEIIEQNIRPGFFISDDGIFDITEYYDILELYPNITYEKFEPIPGIKVSKCGWLFYMIGNNDVDYLVKTGLDGSAKSSEIFGKVLGFPCSGFGRNKQFDRNSGATKVYINYGNQLIYWYVYDKYNSDVLFSIMDKQIKFSKIVDENRLSQNIYTVITTHNWTKVIY